MARLVAQLFDGCALREGVFEADCLVEDAAEAPHVAALPVPFAEEYLR